jgi:hypothetical protein
MRFFRGLRHRTRNRQPSARSKIQALPQRYAIPACYALFAFSDGYTSHQLLVGEISMATKSRSKKSVKQPSTSAPSAGAAPRASRPVVPSGYRFPTSPEGLLDWSWARERLTNSHNYVIVTVRPDGRPHAMGMHGLWFDDAYYFGTDVDSRKAKNLTKNAHCVLVCENFHELVIVEGSAETIDWDSIPEGLSEASSSKYGWPMKPHKGGAIYRMSPRVVFAFPLDQIATAVTRWAFD